MSRLNIISEKEGVVSIVSFKCPGCGDEHTVRVNGPSGSSWGYNQSVDAPTFTPSILVRSGHYAPNFGEQSSSCWCTYHKEHPGETSFQCYICHSYVTDGKIQFLNDCTHSMAGQTVDLPDSYPNKQ